MTDRANRHIKHLNVTIDIKRIILTTAVCTAASFLPLTISNTVDFYPFLVPLLFSIVIQLTCFDKITTRKKYQAFVLSATLTTGIFFVSVMFGLFLAKSFIGQYSIFLVCALSGLLTLLSFSLTMKMDNIKLGLGVTALLVLVVPPLTALLRGQKILNIEFFGDPATFFIVWQTVVGLALAISIWTRTKERSSAHNSTLPKAGQTSVK